MVSRTPTWLDPELTGLPGATAAVGNHGGGRVPVRGGRVPSGGACSLRRGTKTPKCWGVLACGTTSERPIGGYSRRATACLQVRWLQELKSSAVWGSPRCRGWRSKWGWCRRTVSWGWLPGALAAARPCTLNSAAWLGTARQVRAGQTSCFRYIFCLKFSFFEK